PRPCAPCANAARASGSTHQFPAAGQRRFGKCHRQNCASLRLLLRAPTKTFSSHAPEPAYPCPIGKASAGTALEIYAGFPFSGLCSSSFQRRISSLRVFVSSAAGLPSPPLRSPLQNLCSRLSSPHGPELVQGSHTSARRKCAARRFPVRIVQCPA